MRDKWLCENCLSYAHFVNGSIISTSKITRKHLGSLHDVLLASFHRKHEEISSDMQTQGPSVSSSASDMQTISGHFVMRSSLSVAGGSHECRTLPIVPVKDKGGTEARSLQLMPC